MLFWSFKTPEAIFHSLIVMDNQQWWPWRPDFARFDCCCCFCLILVGVFVVMMIDVGVMVILGSVVVHVLRSEMVSGSTVEYE